MKYLVTAIVVTIVFFLVKLILNMFALAKRISTAIDSGDDKNLTDKEKKMLRDIKERLNKMF